MHVVQTTVEQRGVPITPAWVPDWWMPEADLPTPDIDVDMPALLVPEPPPHIEVTGRRLQTAATTR
ncbi:MAG TPA: hypothetical protein VN193_16905 [Candidatus Angelobacter sp.]|nr:hypothetical protein [Candidatus Angelobacter sp.]